MTDMMLPAVAPWVAPWIVQWMTPLWLLGFGALVGLVVVALVAGLASLLSPKFGRGMIDAFLEGPLKPIGITAAVLASFGIFGFFFAEDPGAAFTSIKRVFSVGSVVTRVTLPPASELGEDDAGNVPMQSVAVSFRRNELRRIVIQSDQNLEMRTAKPVPGVGVGVKMEVIAGEQSVWLPPQAGIERVFPDEAVVALYGKNLGDKPANVAIELTTSPPVPEVTTIPLAAVSVIAIFAIYLLQSFLFPKVSAVALSTFKSETAQPVFIIFVIVGAVVLLLFLFVPCNTFGEDIKMMKKAGVNLLLLVGVMQSVWAASSSIADEIEGRTALTVLSKPLSRSSFIIGKFTGIAWTVVFQYCVLGLIFLILVAYKPIHDSREGGQDATWQICHAEMVRCVPGMLLAFMETVVIASISVAISTRLPMMANMVMCVTIFALGNLTPMIVKSAAGRFDIVQFFGQLIATVFPNLESFTVEAAISGGVPVPISYLGLSAVYCAIYTLIALLLALILFEDCDLA